MMTTFLTALLWGTGLSLGICVGLVAWMFLKEVSHWLLGIDAILDENRKFNKNTLGALLDRNRISEDTNDQLLAIWQAIKEKPHG